MSYSKLNESLQKLQDASYEYCMATHENKSTEELEKIILTNAQIIQAIPNNNTNFELEKDCCKKLGEIKACKKILQERKKEKNHAHKKQINILNEKTTWKKELDKRRKNAVLNLPVAVTYNAQLIVAFLESESPKTAIEIANCIRDFVPIDETEVNALLKQLISEEILYCDSENKYFLLNICTETLFPVHPIEWATKKLLLKGKSISEKEIQIISAIDNALEPLTDEELKEKIGNVKLSVKNLVQCDVLRKYKCESEDIYMYYFTMLGEKTRREK